MKGYLRKWNIMRVLYLAASVFVVIQGFQMGNWMVIILGGLFGLMPVFNVSMCGPRGCNPPRRTYTPTQSGKKISFEEVK